MEAEVAKGFLSAYQELGVAGLFILLYITTVWYLIRTLVQSKVDATNETQKVVTALNEAVTATESMAETIGELKESVDGESKKIDELLTYLKLRDQLQSRR
jgi:uncharacterized protein Yka (UPF0111/DUF47 family)